MKSALTDLAAIAVAAIAFCAAPSLYGQAAIVPREEKNKSDELKVFDMKNANARVLAEQLKQIIPGINIVADERTNNLLVRGTREQVEMAESIAMKLDQAESRPPMAYQNAPAAAVNTTPARRAAGGLTGGFGGEGGGFGGFGAVAGGRSGNPPTGTFFGATTGGGSGWTAFAPALETAEAQFKAAEAAAKAADAKYKELEAALQKVQSAAKASKVDDIAAQLEEIRAMTENQRREAEKQRRLADEQRRTAEKLAKTAVSRWEVQLNRAPSETDKRVQELVAKIHELTQSGQQSTEDGKRLFAELKEALRKALDTQLQERQKTESDELRQLRLRLEKLEKEISDRAANRQSLIDRRLEDLLSDQSRVIHSASGSGILTLKTPGGDSVLTLNPPSDLTPTTVTGTVQLSEPGTSLILSPNVPSDQLKLPPAEAPPSDSAPLK